MIRKFASVAVLDAWRVPAGNSARALRKAAHRVSFAYTPRPGYLYVRARAISSRCNDNWDAFPAGEIEKGYRTFLGKPCFINHHNANHRRARGVIVAAALHRDRNPDGTPDTWVELLHEIDALRFPKFAKAILSGRVNRTSMGVDCEYSTCSACGNRATSPAEYCTHMPAKKGMRHRRRNQVTGKLEESIIHEICAGLTFFENSFLVEDPADPTAYIVDKPYLHPVTGARKTAAPNGPHPGRLQGGTCRENCTYGGTHCAVCHEQVRINLHKTDINGGWHHHDGMKRDHEATPADPEGVMASVPGVQAAKEQARMDMAQRFLDMGFPPKKRKDVGELPPDPFLASRTAATMGQPKDVTCPACGSPRAVSRNASEMAQCSDCGTHYNHYTGRVLEPDEVAVSHAAQDNYEDYERRRKAGEELFRHFTPNYTHPMPGWDEARDWRDKAYREELQPHPLSGRPIPMYPSMRGAEDWAAQRREHVVQDPAATGEFRIPEGPVRREHLSARTAAEQDQPYMLRMMRHMTDVHGVPHDVLPFLTQQKFREQHGRLIHAPGAEEGPEGESAQDKIRRMTDTGRSMAEAQEGIQLAHHEMHGHDYASEGGIQGFRHSHGYDDELAYRGEHPFRSDAWRPEHGEEPPSAGQHFQSEERAVVQPYGWRGEGGIPDYMRQREPRHRLHPERTDEYPNREIYDKGDDPSQWSNLGSCKRTYNQKQRDRALRAASGEPRPDEAKGETWSDTHERWQAWHDKAQRNGAFCPSCGAHKWMHAQYRPSEVGRPKPEYREMARQEWDEKIKGKTAPFRPQITSWSGLRAQAITGESAEPGEEIFARPTGDSPVGAHYRHMMQHPDESVRPPGSGRFHSPEDKAKPEWIHPHLTAPDHGPYYVARDPDDRDMHEGTYHLLDREGRDATGRGGFKGGAFTSGWGQAYKDWHRLTYRAEPPEPHEGDIIRDHIRHVQEHPPQFPHTRVDPYDVEVARRPDARVAKPEGASSSEEWHGPYEVVKHPETGKFHIMDNAGKDATPGWQGFRTQMQAERSRDYIDRRMQSKEHGKALADKLFGDVMEIMDPGGTPESRESERNTQAGQELMTRYEGGRGKIKFDPDEEGGAPYYERDHYLPNGKPSGWYAKHYGGTHFDIYHRGTRDEAHDAVFGLPSEPGEHGEETYQLHHGFGDAELGGRLKEWHDEEHGMRAHLETEPWQYGGNERIQRWKGRHMGRRTAATRPPEEVGQRWPERTSHCVNCGLPFTSEETDPEHPENWRDPHVPHLCVECAGPRMLFDKSTGIGKPPPAEHDPFGGQGSGAASEEFMHGKVPSHKVRRWTQDDRTLHSLSALQREEALLYKHPEDHPFFQVNPASSENVKHAWFHHVTDDEKDQARRWYPDAHIVAVSIAHGNAALGAGMLSAYSPLTRWPANMFNAARSIHEGRAMGTQKGDGAIMAVHWRPAQRILAGEHHSDVFSPKTAMKTRAFAHLIEHGGNTEDDIAGGTPKVVVDRHALSVAIGRRVTDEEYSQAPISKARFYHHVAGKYIDAAADISRETGHTVDPSVVQAGTWLSQVRRNEAEDATMRGRLGRGRITRGQQDVARWQDFARQHHPDLIQRSEIMHLGSLQAMGGDPPLRVPQPVDTLRPEACPVCGNSDVFKGQRCPVCGFVSPPDIFRDPDIDQARLNRQELEDGIEESPYPEGPADEQQLLQQQIGSGEDADEQLMHPDQIAPDGVPGVQPEGAPGQGMLEPTGEQPELDENGEPVEPAQGGEEELPPEDEQLEGTEEAEEGAELEQAGEEEQERGAQDAAAEEAGEEEGLSPGKEQDEDERPGGKMPKRSAATAAVTASDQAVAELRRENAVLRTQLQFVAELAGIGPELDAIRRQADLANPGQPVPDPPQEPPVQSTEEALASGAPTGSGTGEHRGPGHSEDDPSRPGTTPGSLTAVPAEQTTTAITPGADLPTPPANQLVDVTAPVQGTNPSQDGGVPIEQRRIETDVRVNPNPLAAQGPGIGGLGNDGTAYPWTIAARQAIAGEPSAEDERGARTMASIRLARLRVTAGLARGDELEVGALIERDAALSLRDIEHEIATLSQVSKVAAQGQPRYPRSLGPRQAARSAPSFAGPPAPVMAMTAGATADTGDDSDLFID